jgi:hypothetical protein
MRGEPADERALSEVLGFVLTFSVIILSVGIVYGVGTGALGDLRANEQMNAADRSMQGLATNFEALYQQSAPSRGLDVGLKGGSLDLVDGSLEVVVRNESGTVLNPDNRTIDVGALVRSDQQTDTELVYEAGALFRIDGPGAVMRHRPVMQCTDEAAVVSLLRLEGNVSLSTSGSVRVRGIRRESSLLFPASGTGQATEAAQVTVDVSPSAVGSDWSRFFDGRPGWQSLGSGRYACQDVDRAYVRVTTVELRTVG